MPPAPERTCSCASIPPHDVPSRWTRRSTRGSTVDGRTRSRIPTTPIRSASDANSAQRATSSRQVMPERAVVVGDGSWLGYGTVVLPGARIGRHVVVGANSVVVGDLPDRCVAVGTPARVVRRHVEGEGWKPAP